MTLPITLTSKALAFYARCLREQKQSGVRFLVKEDKGCAPLRYVVTLTNKREPGDLAEQIEGVNIWVDLQSAHRLHGLTVDLKQEGINQKIIFDHPKAKSTCGCGETFSLDLNDSEKEDA